MRLSEHKQRCCHPTGPEGETLLQKPALFNLSLAVRESDETDDTQPVTIVAGQTPEEAAGTEPRGPSV